MKKTAEIKENQNLRNVKEGIDGGTADIHIGGWDGSVIWSIGAGWEHVSVAPYPKRITPSWDDMCRIKDIFWNDDEAVIQVHPPKAEYVSNVENCLHLWRCIYKKMVLPPSILVGVKKGQTWDDIQKAIQDAWEKAGEKYPYAY